MPGQRAALFVEPFQRGQLVQAQRRLQVHEIRFQARLDHVVVAQAGGAAVARPARAVNAVEAQDFDALARFCHRG